MQSKTFWVGDRPAGTWAIQVRDQKSGEVMGLGGFTTARVILLDPQNKSVEIPADHVAITNADQGIVTFLWPQESLFTRPGRYVMQVELSSNNNQRRTTEQVILVKELGGVTN
jgi:hypothetical protein